MTTKETTKDDAPLLHDIHELKQLLNVPDSVFDGVMAAENWKPGRQVTQTDFEKAVQRFCGSPISGRQVKKRA